MISLEKFNSLTPLQKLPKNVGDLAKLIVALKSCPMSNKSSNLVTLIASFRCLLKIVVEQQLYHENVFFFFFLFGCVISEQK